MINKIVELENDKTYVILEKQELNNRIFYYGVRLDEKEEPTNNYLFFEEFKSEEDTYLEPITDEELRGFLLTVFTIKFLDSVYDY